MRSSPIAKIKIFIAFAALSALVCILILLWNRGGNRIPVPLRVDPSVREKEGPQSTGTEGFSSPPANQIGKPGTEEDLDDEDLSLWNPPRDPFFEKGPDWELIDPEDWSCLIDGYVAYSDGSLVPGAVASCKYIIFDDSGSGYRYEKVGESVVDADGFFIFEKLRQGKYIVEFFERHDKIRKMVRLDSMRRAARLKVVFKLKGRLMGEVKDIRGNPVPNANVRVFIGKVISYLDPKIFNDMIHLKTDEKGIFEASELPPNKVSISINKKGYEFKNLPKVLTIPEGGTERITIVLGFSACVEGTVTLGEWADWEKAGVKIGYFLFTRDEDGSIGFDSSPVKVGWDGSYKLEISRFFKKTILMVLANGFRPRWIHVDLKRGDRKVVNIHMIEKGGILKGRIVLPENSRNIEIEDLTIGKEYDSEEEAYQDDRMWEPLKVKPDADGNFFCNCLDRCKYRVYFSFKKPSGRSWYTRRVFFPDVEDMVVKVPGGW